MFVLSPGSLISRHREIFSRNPLFVGIRLPEPRELESIDKRYPQLASVTLDIIKVVETFYLHGNVQKQRRG